MSVGEFGNVQLSSVSVNEVDVLYAFSPTRSELGDIELKPLFSNISENEFRKMIGADGVFKLRLPASV